jgi:hypothetical protein
MPKRLCRLLTVFLLLLGTGVAVGAAAAPAGALPPYVCGTMTGGSTTVHSHVTDVRVTWHQNFDRFVVVFSTARLPHYTLTPKSSAVFYTDPRGLRVRLLGDAGLKVVLHSAASYPTYHGSADFRTGFRELEEARLIGDFEGYVSWGLGLAHQSCKRVFKLTEPTRLVIDVHH